MTFNAEKLSHSLLRKPDRFVFKKYFHIHFAVASGVEKEV
jgi:hypothetical protein